ncbi:MAG: lipid-transfer protein [Acidobacteria bacterium]|nr:lipid-transfer protein [Acidobacteriota bacterium]
MGRKVFVVGVGMTKFEKPGGREWDYPDMALESSTKALSDARISYREIEQACVGYVYGESTSGQRSVYQLGLTGIPVYNVNNNCSTGSTALFMAKQLVEGGVAECVLALGFEKMEKGSLGAKYTDRTQPMDRHFMLMGDLRGFETSPPAPQLFGNAGREHMERYGSTPEQFARIGVKNHRHSVNNPYAARGLEAQAVEIIAQTMVTDTPATFEDRSVISLIGADMTRLAARKAYEQSGLGPEDVDVIELHDCFSSNELITYEALGLCPEGQGGKLIDEGAVTYGGTWVVNPSGGLISKGHPLGATGLAQCSELSWQIRGLAERRQVPGAKVGLQQNIGLGGAVVVTMYRKADLAA